MTAIFDNNGNILTRYEYDLDGNVSKETTYLNGTEKNTVEYIYNYFGKPNIEIKDVRRGDLDGNAFNNNTLDSLVTEYTYDLNGNVVSIRTPDNLVTTIGYDNLNRQTLISQPGVDEYGNSTTIQKKTEYNHFGEVKSIEDCRGNKTEYEYTPRGFLSRIKNVVTTDGQQKTYYIAYGYDRAGRMVIVYMQGLWSKIKQSGE